MKRYLMGLLLMALVGTAAAQPFDTFEKRADTLLKWTALEYGPGPTGAGRPPGFDNDDPNVPDPEKFNWPAAIAQLHFDLNDDTANARIARFRDNPPFHFPFVGMARIMSLYPNAPQMLAHKEKYLQEVWDRDDSFNAWTGEGTENHVNMNRTSGYLYAQIARDSFPGQFPDAQQKLDSMKTWVEHFSQSVYASGTGEWNSAIYTAFNMMGWLNLYDFATDPDVRKMARAVLDYYAAEMALHYAQGEIGGPEARAARALESTTTETDYFAWLWFGNSVKAVSGDFFDGNTPIHAVHAATSSYRPPQFAIDLAQKKLQTDVFYHESRGDYWQQNPGKVKQYFYIGDGFTLGSATVPYGGYTSSDFQIRSWNLTGMVEGTPGPNKSIKGVTGGGHYYNLPGRFRDGRMKTPYDQVIQHKNVLINLNKMPTNEQLLDDQVTNLINSWKNQWASDFQKRFPNDNFKLNNNPIKNQNRPSDPQNAVYVQFPDGVDAQKDGGIFFMDLGRSYAAVQSVALAEPTDASVSDSRNFIFDEASAGQLTGLIVEAADAEDFNNYAAFRQAIKSQTTLDKSTTDQDSITYVGLNGEVIGAKYGSSGSFSEMLYDWGFGPEKRQVIIQSPPFEQPPWPSGEGFGKVPSWTVNGEPVNMDARWPVFDGPNLSLKDSILAIKNGQQTYRVDYRGPVPVFDTLVTSLEPQASEKSQDLRVFPNPTSEQAQVALPESIQEAGMLQVFDLAGRSVLRKPFRPQSQELQFGVEGLDPGIYLLEISTENQRRSVRLVVE